MKDRDLLADLLERFKRLELEKETKLLRDWIEMLAHGGEAEVGYNGVGPNTFEKAKATSRAIKTDYPFQNVGEFKQWLKENAAKP